MTAVAKTNPLASTVSVPDVGLDGPGSVAISTESDDRIRRETERCLEIARDLRETLRADQAETEKRGYYSLAVHDAFVEAGFYRLLQPLKFGGSEITVASFYSIISEIARGCPSTGWCLCLGAAHALQLGSYWPVEVQEEIFSENGHFISPLSSSGQTMEVEEVDGGLVVSGVWRYSSGVPYSTHFIGTISLAAEGNPRSDRWFIARRDDYEVMDDWGGILGMRGSGSNSVRLDHVFVPSRYIVECGVREAWSGHTPGSAAHGNPMYAGTFSAFAVGEISSVAVGLGYAVLDEYERIIRTTKAPYASDGSLRIDHEDWRRCLGLAMATVDAAAAISAHNAELYVAYAERSIAGIEPFSVERSLRLRNANVVVQDMVFSTTYDLLKTAGSSTLLDGQRMQRYYRDITTMTTRTSQLGFNASETVAARLDQR